MNLYGPYYQRIQRKETKGVKLKRTVYDRVYTSIDAYLETRVQPHQERMIGGRFEYGLLRLHPINILVVVEHLLLDDLDRIDLPGPPMFGLDDLRIRALPNNGQELEVVQRHLPSIRLPAPELMPVLHRFDLVLVMPPFSVGQVRGDGDDVRGDDVGRNAGRDVVRVERGEGLFGARASDEAMAFLVDAHPAYGASEAGAAQAPDIIVAQGTLGPLAEPLGLELMAVDMIEGLLPSSSASAIHGF